MIKILLLVMLTFTSLNSIAECFKERGLYNCYIDNRLYYSGSMTISNEQNRYDAIYYTSSPKRVMNWLSLTGSGTFYYKNGDKFSGDFFQGKEVYGTYEYKTGETYIGNWKNNKVEGKGNYYSKKGNLIYSGNYINGKKDGFGTSYWDVAQKKKSYSGQWKSSEIHGQGTRYFYDGTWSTVTGKYLNGKWQGEMEVVFSPNSKIYSIIGEIYEKDKKYSWNGKTIINYKNGAIAEKIYSQGDVVNTNWIVTQEEANKKLAENQRIEKTRLARIAAENKEKQRKLKQEEEIYNQCILDKIPNARTETAADLIKNSCLEISKNPTRWQLIKYLGFDGVQDILN